MPISVILAGALTPLKAESVMVGGVLRKLRTVKVMRGGALVQVAAYNPASTNPPAAFSATPSPDSAYGFSSSPRPILVTSNEVTAVVTGGVPPFNYSCAIVSGSPMTITAPTSATTQFQKVVAGSATAIARWTITDSLGAVATCDCPVSLENSA